MLERFDIRPDPEGWTIYPLTVGPQLRNTTYNADYHYYNWVDQFNTSGLGENLPIAVADTPVGGSRDRKDQRLEDRHPRHQKRIQLQRTLAAWARRASPALGFGEIADEVA